MLGTRAQFIKVAPIMRKMIDQGLNYKLIYTAQHRENINEILEVYDLPKPDFVFHNLTEANTGSSFFIWFISTLKINIFNAKNIIPHNGIVLSHGDTFSYLV